MKYRRPLMALCIVLMLLSGMVFSLSVSAEPVEDTTEDIAVVLPSSEDETEEPSEETEEETTTYWDPTDEFGITIYPPPPSEQETTTTTTTTATTTTTTTTTVTTTKKTTHKTIRYNPEHPEDTYTGALWAGRVVWPWEKTSKGQTEPETLGEDDLYFDEDYTDNHAADHFEIPFEEERNANWLLIIIAGAVFLLALAAVLFLLMKGKSGDAPLPEAPLDDIDRYGPANPFFLARLAEEDDTSAEEDQEAPTEEAPMEEDPTEEDSGD